MTDDRADETSPITIDFSPDTDIGRDDDHAAGAASDDFSDSEAMPPVPDFGWDLLPSSICSYVRDVSIRQGSPPEFVAVSIMAAIAAIVGNGVRIAPKAHDSWSVVPNMWAMSVGDASMMKTPALQAGLMPLDYLQSMLDREFEDDRDILDAQMELSRLINDELRARARSAIRAQDPQEAYRLVLQTAKIARGFPVRLQVGNTTETRLVQLLAENRFGLLAVHDELPALFSRLLKRSGASERALMLKAANGDLPHDHDRAGRERLQIPQLTLSVVGGIQPSRISGIVRDAHSEGADGLLQRFQLTVWPDPIPERRGVDLPPDEAAAETVRRIFRDVYDFARSGPETKIIRFTRDAQPMIDAWWATNLVTAKTKQPALQSHLVKSGRTIAGLALLIELMNGGRAAVSASSAETSLRWAPFLAAHAERLYAVGSWVGAAQRILEKRGELPHSFTARDVYRSNWMGLGRGATESGLTDLVRRGYLGSALRSTGGRPTTVYAWTDRARR